MKEKSEAEPYVFILGQPFPRGEIIKLSLIAFFVLLMSTVGGLFIYKDWRKGQESRAAKQQEIQQMEAATAVLQKAQIDPLKAFFQSYLEQTRYDQVESIRAVGVYTVGDLSMELTFLAKRPRLYRQTLTKGDQLIEFGYDGEAVWFEQSHGVVDSADPALMNLNKALAILESTIPCLAWDYDPKASSSTFELMPNVEWQGHACYVIKNTKLLEGSPVYHYIDQATGFERYRRASVQIAPRRYKDVELFYTPPAEGAAYSIPSGMELLLDGRLYYKVAFETVEVNHGIPTFLFRR